MEPKPIFLTGATGFLGRHVVAHLLRGGRKLVLAVRDWSRCPAEWNGRPEISIFETGELGPYTDFGDALNGVGAVVHLAGLAHVAAGDGQGEDAAFMRANAGATGALARAAAAAGASTFVHASSLAAIAPNALDRTIDDSTELGPSTPYGRSKRLAESHVRTLADNGVFAVSLRPPLIVGADARGNWAALQALAHTGLPLPFASIRNRRAFIGVEALSEAIALLCEKPWPAELSGNYAIADRELLSLPEVTRLLREGMGRPARLLPLPAPAFDMIGALTGRRRRIAGLTGNLLVDASRFERIFGFQPSVSLREEIVRSGKEYAASREAK